jgi:hypothetical protein
MHATKQYEMNMAPYIKLDTNCELKLVPCTSDQNLISHLDVADPIFCSQALRLRHHSKVVETNVNKQMQDNILRLDTKEGKQFKNQIVLEQRRRNMEGRFVQEQAELFYKDISVFKSWNS